MSRSLLFLACACTVACAPLSSSEGPRAEQEALSGRVTLEQALSRPPVGVEIHGEAVFRGLEHPVLPSGPPEAFESTLVWLDTTRSSWVTPLGTGRMYLVAEREDGWAWTGPVDHASIERGALEVEDWDGQTLPFWRLANNRIGVVAAPLDDGLPVVLNAECDGGACGVEEQPASIRLSAEQFPEAAVATSKGTWFVGSMTGGNIEAIRADGSRYTFAPERDGRVGLGLAIDEARNRLWSCSVTEEGYLGEVRAYDLSTGAVLEDHDLTALVPEGSCNDLVVADAGEVYVTDRENPHIYRIAEGRASILSTDPDLLDSWVVGTNGIALHPSGRGLYVTNYLPARLMYVPFDDPDAVVEVAVHGASISDGLTGGADGIVWFEGALYVSFPSKLVRFVPENHDPTRGWGWEIDLAGGVSDVAVYQDTLFVSNGQPAAYLLGLTPDPFQVEPVDWADWTAPFSGW